MQCCMERKIFQNTSYNFQRRMNNYQKLPTAKCGKQGTMRKFGKQMMKLEKAVVYGLI